MELSTYLDTNKPIAIAVIGDICLDLAYQVTTDSAEISVETGLQTYSVTSTKAELGGGCNVAVNCKTLGANHVDLYGIIGNDFFGDLLVTLLIKQGIGTEGIITQDIHYSSHVYHKIYEKGEEHPRLDSGNFNEPTEKSLSTLLTILKEKLSNYDAILINEQVPKGLHTPAFQRELNAIIASSTNTLLWFADCRKLNDIYAHTIHKLNEQEGRMLYEQHHGKKPIPLPLLVDWLYQHFTRPVVLTLGDNGALVRDESGTTPINGLHFTSRIDPVGAGDAFLAGMSIALCRKASFVEASYLGNFCAGVSLQILYETGHPTVEQVLSLASKAQWRYNSQLAQDPRLATFYHDTPIEVINPVVSRFGFPKVAIFDHDGTISTLRQGWEAVMEETMLAAITGDSFGSLSLDILSVLKKEIKTFIDRTTGIQTIEQMHHLVEMIRSHGFVPNQSIGTPLSYKRLYNAHLLSMVGKKTHEVKTHRLSAEDVTIKGALSFLRLLHSQGTTLYLASGTDVEDVQKEASLLGYSDLFEGRIFGSVGDIENDPKRIVIQKILSSLQCDPSLCVVFGDGPVEMREAKRQGICAIGVVSDEVRRYGMNPDKRERLVLGGSDLLIPDFSYAPELCELLGWELS